MILLNNDLLKEFQKAFSLSLKRIKEGAEPYDELFEIQGRLIDAQHFVLHDEGNDLCDFLFCILYYLKDKEKDEIVLGLELSLKSIERFIETSTDVE
jgi:hypothetical protein